MFNMNDTANKMTDEDINSTCLFVSETESFNVPRICVISVVATAAYFGNTLILLSLRNYSAQFKGKLYVLIGNLAVSNLLLAVSLTLQLIEYVLKDVDRNKYFCLVKACCTSVAVLSSGTLLFFISLDRCIAIVFPMKHLLFSTKKNRTRIKLSIVWILSISIGCIPIIGKMIFSENGTTFTCTFSSARPNGISYVVVIVIPLQFVLNFVLCVVVIWRLRTNNMSRHKYKKTMKKCGLLIKVYIAYALSWTPFVVATILTETNKRYRCVREYSIIPGLLNAAMNWVIYGLTNANMRAAFRNIVQCRSQREYQMANYIKSNRLQRSQASADVCEDYPC